MPNGDVPNATVVQGGKLGGDVPKGAGGGPRTVHKRRLSNYLLDAKLQLRYVLLVTILSGVIAGSLGYLIHDQRHSASSHIDDDLGELTKGDATLAEFRSQIADEMDQDDRYMIYKMIGMGVGLIVILSGYLLIMTHKVAGPLYKTSMYFDRMAAGRLGEVTALRRGDMLQDFFGDFKEAHDTVRARFKSDADAMASAAERLRGKVGDDAVAAMDKHVAARRAQLA